MTPFLKWAGGKRWLVERYADLIPSFSGCYYEPFLGGGSVYFHLDPHRAVITDSNARLIECYLQIRENHRQIESLLKEHQRLHCKDHYYKVRSTQFLLPEQRAAQFIYLNRTCWNGLYRVNLKGEFNVPIGTKSKVLFEREDFAAIADRLNSATILHCDFETSINMAGAGDFVFVDPPYTVKHDLNGFLKYNEQIFGWDDQVRLREAVARASRRGARILVSNAAHASVRELYAGIGETIVLERGSVLSGKPEARGRVNEILVRI